MQTVRALDPVLGTDDVERVAAPVRRPRDGSALEAPLLLVEARLELRARSERAALPRGPRSELADPWAAGEVGVAVGVGEKRHPTLEA